MNFPITLENSKVKLLENAGFLSRTNNAELIRPTAYKFSPKGGHCPFKNCLGISGKANEECQLGLLF